MTMPVLLNKRIALAVVFTLSPGAAVAATAGATANVVTLRPATMVRTDDLDFGALIASATAGTVKIDPSTDARTTTGGVSVAGGAPSAARFVATGVVGLFGTIGLPGSITLVRSGGTETMTVSAVTTNGPTVRLFTGTPTLDVRVGGTLNVGANQVGGNYSGQFNVTVFYF
jgi:hypothetical protein